MSSLGIIPIRYRSSRLPNKTFLDCGGKQLIDWTIETAFNSNLDTVIIVSSCEVVKQYCDKNGLHYVKRPRGLESDNCHVLHTINWLNDNEPLERGYDIQMLLQVTNPTRIVYDIDRSLELLEAVESANSICSIVDVGEFHYSRMYKRAFCNTLEPVDVKNQWSNTQYLDPMFLRDGSIYAWRTKAFLQFGGNTLLPQRILGFEIPRERSIRIDTQRDLDIADKILTHPEKMLTS